VGDRVKADQPATRHGTASWISTRRCANGVGLLKGLDEARYTRGFAEGSPICPGGTHLIATHESATVLAALVLGGFTGVYRCRRKGRLGSTRIPREYIRCFRNGGVTGRCGGASLGVQAKSRLRWRAIHRAGLGLTEADRDRVATG